MTTADPPRRTAIVLSVSVARGACEAGVLSYLYCDACYAEGLVDMGRRDAAVMEGELVELFT